MKELAHGVVEAMRAQPLALALVILNLLFLAGIGYVVADAAAAVRVREARASEQIAKLINECLVPRSAQ